MNILNTKISGMGKKVFREKFIVINAFKGKRMQVGNQEVRYTFRKKNKLKESRRK